MKEIRMVPIQACNLFSGKPGTGLVSLNARAYTTKVPEVVLGGIFNDLASGMKNTRLT
jgi:hypothetical protein